ncbi:fumarylacetoacetate hydrolase family protein [Amycolatopsis sp. GM8]|uniref:fumarylacetoacetate hydrolase family protein n=1 Tax=Amycolatopsis sp. GM8 TaxID=2896530 RepID=UPI001F0313DE|nr:fumarylacetoacetate hydrolase family protein [Amycolatopsis sp. GM8]
MILATLWGGGIDGTLVVVSRDRRRLVIPPRGPRTMQQALDEWSLWEHALEDTFGELDDERYGFPVERARFDAPLPRAFHWAEGSCYLQHMERIRGSRSEALPVEHLRRPIVYQSGSARNMAPRGDIALPDPAWELDLEGTVVVITGAIRGAASEDEAGKAIRLVGITNDLTYRKLLVDERRQGTGVYWSKPGRAYAPFVVTPSTLDTAWTGANLRAALRCEVNGDALGAPRSDQDITFEFPRILAHLTATRPLVPGSIVGTGTVSNADPAAGYACIAEKRAVEIAKDGAATTPFLGTGDTVGIEALGDDGTSLFGRIEQTVVAA